jgi:hypothetical protein
MKKIVCIGSVVILLMVFTGAAFADQKNTGCGLGSMLFEGKDGLFSQIFAATTNGTFGNQTFGISSGTSNCDKPSSFASNEKLNKYVADNMDNLATDMAKGNGEYLNTLAVLMEIPQAERANIYEKLQNNFSQIFTSSSISSVEVLNNIEAVLVSS